MFNILEKRDVKSKKEDINYLFSFIELNLNRTASLVDWLTRIITVMESLFPASFVVHLIQLVDDNRSEWVAPVDTVQLTEFDVCDVSALSSQFRNSSVGDWPSSSQRCETWRKPSVNQELYN